MVEYPMIQVDRRWTLYVHINKINKKRYVGITNKKKPTSRWGTNGIGYKGTKHFYFAIQKYGWNNFDHIIIEQNLTKNEASNLEIMLISVWRTQDQQYGYNFQAGGYSGNLGMHMSKESNAKRCGEKNGKSKKVVCLNNKKIYVSQIAAARDNNINCPGQIGMAADGIRQFSGKDKNGIPLLWVRYEEFVNMTNEEIEERLSKTVKRTSEHSVICLNTMRVFNSVFDASNYCGSYTSGIIRCAQSWFGKQTGHIRKHCGRDPQTGELLSWIYKDDFDKLSDEKKMAIIDSYKKR